MKLFVCRQCLDVVKIIDLSRICECRQSIAKFDAGHVLISGPAEVLEFNNDHFMVALAEAKYYGSVNITGPRLYVKGMSDPDTRRV